MDKSTFRPFTREMEWKFLKARSGQHASAVCVASLLIAANDFGYSTPLHESYHEQVLCINHSEPVVPRIQFSKGDVQHKSFAGRNHQPQVTVLADGDTITTGSDGFVRVLLTEERYANVQPFTQVRFDSSLECHAGHSGNDADVHLDTPYLSAAIRG